MPLLFLGEGRCLRYNVDYFKLCHTLKWNLYKARALFLCCKVTIVKSKVWDHFKIAADITSELIYLLTLYAFNYVIYSSCSLIKQESLDLLIPLVVCSCAFPR